MAEQNSTYQVLDLQSVPTLIAGLDPVRARLGGSPADWSVREVGDGNLNLVFLVDGPQGSVCLKQALPYVRVAGPGWPLSPQRAHFESAYFRSVAPHVGKLIPAVYHHDAGRHFTIMERLSPHIILRQGLIAGRRYPQVGRAIGEYVARACFHTSDLAGPFETKLDGVALFAGNKPLIRISVDLIFAEPYFDAPRNRHTSPQLDETAAELRRDPLIKVRAARFGQKFLSEAQALLHGDLHSGSVMVTETDTRVIDPEFAFYGPIGFDLGAFFGNLLLSWYSQFGRESDADDRSAHRAWILEQMKVFWSAFRSRFLSLWADNSSADVFPQAMFATAGDAAALESAREAFVDTLFADMLGFGACKMIRRILGFAHVLDLDGIVNADVRAACERSALGMAATLLRHPEHFKTIEDVAEAVPRFHPGRP